eukprot:646639-Pelagomonas_calceolata.AAC.9
MAGALMANYSSRNHDRGDPMDGWCFDGVAGVLEGCFEDEGPVGAGSSSGGMDTASSQIKVQPCSSSGHNGEIAKAAAAQSGSARALPARGALAGETWIAWRMCIELANLTHVEPLQAGACCHCAMPILTGSGSGLLYIYREVTSRLEYWAASGLSTPKQAALLFQLQNLSPEDIGTFPYVLH